MQIRILSWKYRNIRGGLDGVEVDLGSPPARWTLIQMPNGMGKTTTMHLLRAAFTGASMSEAQVRSFKPFEQARDGLFELVLTLDSSVYRITTLLDYEQGTVSYETARAATTGGGKQEGHIFPPELKPLLTEEFAKLFIFDGELARQIRTLESRAAIQAIRALYRLDTLTELGAQIDHIVGAEQQRANDLTKAKSAQGLKNLSTRLETARSSLHRLKGQESQLRAEIAAAHLRLAALERAIHDHVQEGEQFRDRANQLTLDLSEVNQKLGTTTERVLAELRNPVTIHSRIISSLHELSGKMQRLKLPKTMSTEFFHELAEGTTCVCGRDIGELEKEIIRQRAQEFLSDDEISVVNEIKSAIRSYTVDDTRFSDSSTELRVLIRKQHQLRGDWERLQTERVAAGDDELERIRKERDGLKNDVQHAETRIEALTCSESSLQRKHRVDDETNIPLCTAQIEQRAEALARATGTVVLQAKAKLTKQVLQLIAERALVLIKDRLKSATNAKLETLLRGERIRVLNIGGALELESDALGSKQQVSEGQSLAIAYAFLTSLFEEAPHALPFVVDSPAGSLDLEVRREVAELIPDLFEQLIMFVISSEREAFAEPFYARSGVRYCTISKDPSGSIKVEATIEAFKHFQSDDSAAATVASIGGEEA